MNHPNFTILQREAEFEKKEIFEHFEHFDILYGKMWRTENRFIDVDSVRCPVVFLNGCNAMALYMTMVPIDLKVHFVHVFMNESGSVLRVIYFDFLYTVQPIGHLLGHIYVK